MLTKIARFEGLKDSADLLASINHNNLVKFYEMKNDGNTFYMITDNYVQCFFFKYLTSIKLNDF